MKNGCVARVLSAVPMMVLVSLGIARPAQNAQSPADQTQAPKPSLAAILKATGDYCEIVKKMSLYFVCNERIQAKENFFTRGKAASRSTPDALLLSKVIRQSFLYDYQIIKKGEEFEEKRILLEENGKSRRRENADLGTLKVSGRNLVFGPVGFFSRYWQKYFNYEVLGEDVLNGRTVVIIGVVPNEKREENNNRGKTWIDASNYQILRIEFEPPSGQDADVTFEGNTPKAAEFHRHFVWTIDYGVEKNGVRFPSRQTISENLVSSTGFKITKREVLFEFTNYRFFTVDVEHKFLP